MRYASDIWSLVLAIRFQWCGRIIGPSVDMVLEQCFVGYEVRE
jgi:hypothetical protein